MQNFVLIYEAAFSFREIHPLIPLIGRIHGAIVAATIAPTGWRVAATIGATIAPCIVYALLQTVTENILIFAVLVYSAH